MSNTIPDISNYDDYRKFLEDWFHYKKSLEPNWTYREFSNLAGFKSPNQLWLVIRGKRNITKEALSQYLSVLDLKLTERKIFAALVLFNQARDVEEQKIHWKELCELKKRRGISLDAEQYKYMTNWYYAAVCEMVNLKDFREDGTWIAKRLGGLISTHQAEEALRCGLHALGLGDAASLTYRSGALAPRLHPEPQSNFRPTTPYRGGDSAGVVRFGINATALPF